MSVRNPTNFLELAQRACVECGVASSTGITTALTSVDTATGSIGRVCNWVADGWTDIQMDNDQWDWMRSSNILGTGISFATVAGQPSYPLGIGAGTVGVAVDSFGKWVEEDPDGSGSSFWNHTTAVGVNDEMQMPVQSFGLWRNTYMQGANRNVRTRPSIVAIGPDHSLCLGQMPNGLYTVTGDYFMAPSNMVNDIDTPLGLPARFWLMIVYRCMMKYGEYIPAPEVFSRGSRENDEMYAQLTAMRAPKVSWSGALA